MTNPTETQHTILAQRLAKAQERIEALEGQLVDLLQQIRSGQQVSIGSTRNMYRPTFNRKRIDAMYAKLEQPDPKGSPAAEEAR